MNEKSYSFLLVPGNDSRYKSIPASALPRTEALSDCVARVVPYWYDQIVPQVLDGKNVLVVAHGNSIRSIVKHIDNISETDIIGVNIPTSVPLIYEFDANFKPVKNYYLGKIIERHLLDFELIEFLNTADPEELKKKQEAVSNQGKKK